MKKLSTILLTLVLSVSMLAPDFSLLTPVFATNETPAVEQTDEGNANEVAPFETDENVDDPAAQPDDEGVTAAEEDGTLEDGTEEEPATPAEPIAIEDSYAKIQFTELDEQGGLPIPEDLQDKITKSHAQYADGVLFNGTVADLNALKVTVGAFNFDSGSVGRLSFDGLKDKDAGMTVEVLVYLDDSEEPVASIPLKKQMGKKEWSNAGDKSISLGDAGISGNHVLSLGLKITGKKDTAETSVFFRSLQFCKTTIPIMYFNIDESEGTIEAMNASADHSVECYGNVDLIVPDEFNADTTFRDEYGTQSSLKGVALEYIRGRGNSTWDSDKKPYKVKFDKAQNLFGFGKNKHWVLLANRYDNSLVRNRMTYWLGQQLGMPYTPQCVPVEVVMNDQFYGSYLLCEQIRVGTGRVTIDDLDDIKDVPAVTDPLIETGGYLLSLDYEYDKDHSFITDSATQFYIESPDKNVSYYHDYIKAFTQKVENAILSDNFQDESGHPYTDYLDIDRAVDYWWVQEFSENGDAYGSGSTYLYKARDTEDGIGKLCWGPLWDFDFVAWGDLEYDEGPQETLDYTRMPWFDAMKNDPVFIEKAKARWMENGGLKDKLNDIVKEGGRLDQYLAQMETSYDYDHGMYGPYESDYTKYKDEIEQLRTWIQKRIEYVDEAVKNFNTEPHKVKFMVDGELVKEVSVIGRIREKNFPDDPEKDGMVFVGWAMEEDDYLEPLTVISDDMVVNAEFVSQSEVIQPKDIFFRSYDEYYGIDTSYAEDEIYEYYDNEYVVMPEDAWESEITWTSSDENVVECNEEMGGFFIKGFGDAVITATLKNGVSKSFTLHVISYEDMKMAEEITLDQETLKLKEGEYAQLTMTVTPQPCETPDVMWISADEDIATVNDIGVVQGVKPGKTQILMVERDDFNVQKTQVTITSADVGKTVKVSGNTYKITSDTSGSRTCKLIKAKNSKRVTIPASIKYNDKTFSVNQIDAKAFAKSKKVRTVTVKTKKLSKARVKNSLKGSKVKTIKVKVGKKKVNKKYIKKYKKYFTKKNAGKKVRVR